MVTKLTNFIQNHYSDSSLKINDESLMVNTSLNLPISDTRFILLNATAFFPIEYAMVMFGSFMPFIIVITLIANSLVIIVLSQRHMRTPTNIVLLAMTISDLSTLLFPAPWYFYMYTLGNHVKVLHPIGACYAFYCMLEMIPNVFHTSSIWLTLLLAGQRYIYVCHLTVARDWCTVPRVKRAIFYIYFACILTQFSRFLDRDFKSINVEKNTTVQGCGMATASWIASTITEDVYFVIYYSFRLIFVHIGPCTALVVLNILLFKALKKAQIKRDKLFQENRKNECKKLRDSNCTTLMLIVVVGVFLATEIPLAITTALHIIQNYFSVTIADYETLNLIILITNFFIMSSCPINFAIYCGMSRQFRETFKDLFISRAFFNINKELNKYEITNGPKTSTNETNL